MTLIETMSEMLQKVRNFGHQKVEFCDVQNRTFRTFPESPEICKIYKICKNHKNRKNLQKSQNLEKVRFLAVWRLPYVTCQKSLPDSKNRKISTFRKSADFWKFWFRTAKIMMSGNRKKVEIFGLSDLQKNRKKVLYPVEIDDRKWRHISLFGGKKNALFRAFFRVKEKNVPFSAILRCFWISRFFSKIDRFEGQCQRRPRKGSPSCPVIFHRTWYWKWSIYTQGGPLFGPPDSKISTFGQSQEFPEKSRFWSDLRKVLRTAILARSSQIAILAGFGQIGAQTAKSWKSLKSCKILKIAEIAQIRTFPQKWRF